MKKTYKILIGISFIIYNVIVLLTNIDFTETYSFNENSVHVLKKNELIRSLESKYQSIILPKSSKDFSEDFIKKLLNGVTIIDTLHIDIVKKAGEFYIYVEAKSDNNGRIFAKLRCDDSIIKKVRNKKFPGALLVAKIEGVNKSNVLGEVKADDYLNLINIGEDVLLTGECLEYIELSNS